MNATPLREARQRHTYDWDASDYYLPSFLPWEVQEVACICEYLTTRWAYILRECSLIVPEDQKKIDDPFADNGWHKIFAHIRSLPVSSEGNSFFTRALYPQFA